MASELTGYGLTAATHYFVGYNATQQLWNGSAFATFNAANWATYAITATEQAGTGHFVGNSPSSATVRYELRQRAGGTAAITDRTVWEDVLLANAGISGQAITVEMNTIEGE